MYFGPHVIEDWCELCMCTDSEVSAQMQLTGDELSPHVSTYEILQGQSASEYLIVSLSTETLA